MSLPSLRSMINALKPGRAPAAPQDCRGGRFVAVIDCVLNQNVRDRGAASFPGMNFELLQLCHEFGVGVLQMPCPEVAALGFRRKRPAGTTIRKALDTSAGRQCCAELAVSLARQMQAAIDEGCELVAVLGGNPRSPGCAVHGNESGLAAESGIFMLALHSELRQRGIDVPFRGLRDTSPDLLAADLQWFRTLLLASRSDA